MSVEYVRVGRILMHHAIAQPAVNLEPKAAAAARKIYAQHTI